MSVLIDSSVRLPDTILPAAPLASEIWRSGSFVHREEQGVWAIGKERAKGLPDWKGLENPQGNTAGIHPVTEQFKINRFIFIFLQPDKFQDTTFIPTSQAADLFQRPTSFHTHSHPKTKVLYVRIAKELCQYPITGHSHFYGQVWKPA